MGVSRRWLYFFLMVQFVLSPVYSIDNSFWQYKNRYFASIYNTDPVVIIYIPPKNSSLESYCFFFLVTLQSCEE